MSWLDEEDLLDAHVVRIDLVRRCVLNVFVKIDHLFDSVVQLSLVPAVQVVSGVLQLAHLRLDLVELLVHLDGVLVIRLSDGVQALLELLLVLVIQDALVLHVLEPPFDEPGLAPLPLVGALLVVKALIPLSLDLLEVAHYLIAQLVHLLDEMERHLESLVLHVDRRVVCDLLSERAHYGLHLLQLLLKLITCKSDFFIFLKGADFVLVAVMGSLLTPRPALALPGSILGPRLLEIWQ